MPSARPSSTPGRSAAPARRSTRPARCSSSRRARAVALHGVQQRACPRASAAPTAGGRAELRPIRAARSLNTSTAVTRQTTAATASASRMDGSPARSEAKTQADARHQQHREHPEHPVHEDRGDGRRGRHLLAGQAVRPHRVAADAAGRNVPTNVLTKKIRMTGQSGRCAAPRRRAQQHQPALAPSAPGRRAPARRPPAVGAGVRAAGGAPRPVRGSAFQRMQAGQADRDGDARAGEAEAGSLHGTLGQRREVALAGRASPGRRASGTSRTGRTASSRRRSPGTGSGSWRRRRVFEGRRGARGSRP